MFLRDITSAIMKYMSLIKVILLIFVITLTQSTALAVEVCSRLAIINYQEVLVDTNSSQKGEGLRFFLSKDKKATQFLNRYQEGTGIRWQSTLLGSIGTIILLSGIFKSTDNSNKTTLMGVGAGLIGLNIVISKTLEKNNEINLIRSIEEYNKRHIPRIYFNTPYNENLRGPSSSLMLDKPSGFMLTLSKEF